MPRHDGRRRQAGTGERDHFIPARKIDVLNAVIAHGALASEPEREQFRQFCRLLGAIYHFEYFDQLERLRNDYFYFSPDLDDHARFDSATVERAYGDLIDALTKVLHGANFVEVPQDEIERAHREHGIVRVNIKAPLEDYREVRFFRRGHHHETVEVSKWLGLGKRSVEFGVYDDVVLLVTMKADDAARQESAGASPGAARRGAAEIFPRHRQRRSECAVSRRRVAMGFRDRLMLGVPALIGGVPILLKLASTVTVLFLVAGFYLGLSNVVRDEEMAGALAAVSGLVALGGFMATQWVRFQRQSLIHQKILSDNVYYRNVNNNAGIFDYVIGEAEEQECKEAFLADYFLLKEDGPTEDVLDVRIEVWLNKIRRGHRFRMRRCAREARTAWPVEARRRQALGAATWRSADSARPRRGQFFPFDSKRKASSG